MDSGLSAALGKEPADLVCRNITLFNPFTCEWNETDLAIQGGRVVGTGDYRGLEEQNFRGAKVIPGLIDSHVHIESSLLTPVEYSRLVLRRGTTTIIADPHEIANAAGTAGLDYMLEQSGETPLDILFMVPSCVPATPLDMGGACLTADDISAYQSNEKVIGLAEMMNVPGVLSGDAEVWKKLSLFRIIDGHAPLLSGKELNAYIYAGIQSDHESTGAAEAKEKLQKGMYLMIREGSTEHNLCDLIPLVNPNTAPRCSFATDDRHADLLAKSGHIDDCIRKAIACGLEPELAFRVATLSAAERFGLRDRGALAPGMLADFCVITDHEGFEVLRTFKKGREVQDMHHTSPRVLTTEFKCAPLRTEDLRIDQSGNARIITINEGQILTGELQDNISGADLPDLDRDILKAVVCDRYRGGGCGVGLVHGFGLKKGAIASSVSHDSHNIVATGSNDRDIIIAVNEVTQRNGGMAAVADGKVSILPLECAGLMSALPYEKVVNKLEELNSMLQGMEAVRNPFMYLSFLALTVIPRLRLTERGVFDVEAFSDVPLFSPQGRS